MNNYHAYMIVNGEEHVDHNPLDLRLAYDEAKRFKEEYNPSEAGVRVFTPNVFRILNWNNGEYRKLKGHYLYTIKVGEDKKMTHIVYSDDEGKFIDDNEEGELVPVDPIPFDELPF